MSNSPALRFCLSALALFVCIPPLTFLFSGLLEGQGIGVMIGAVGERIIGGRPNLIAPSLLSLVPLAILLLLVRLARSRDPHNAWRWRAAWMGLALVVAVLLWANLTAWPLYLPGKQRPGFPHGLELVIAPLFFAPVAALVGWFGGVMLGRTERG